jgi:hypothetical protein
MSRAHVHVTTRPLRYAEEVLSDGTHWYVPREKGIDVRIAIDVLTLADRKAYDVALIFSQDQDLAELVSEIREIAQRQGRWIKLASAFPVGLHTRNGRGIRNTDWIRIDKAIYDRCLDSHSRVGALKELDRVDIQRPAHSAGAGELLDLGKPHI